MRPTSLRIALLCITAMLAGCSDANSGERSVVNSERQGSTTVPPTTVPPATVHGYGGDIGEGGLWRNSDPRFTTQPGVASEDLDLSKLVSGEPADPEWFRSNANDPSNGENGQFRLWCVPSHISFDDPIVYPGQVGAAHEHLFYGNVDANATSTAESIANSGGSTCAGQEANRTAYWFPAMFDAEGRTRIPNQMIVYYKGEGVSPPSGGYSPLPLGIKMIAGDMKATYPNQIPHGFNDGFGCGSIFDNPTSDLIPSAPAIAAPNLGDGEYVRAEPCVGNGELVESGDSNNLTQKVLFPRCWDGKEIDLKQPALFPADTEHTVYPSMYNVGDCPAEFSHAFPEISILFEWELAEGESTQDWYLASDVNHETGETQPGGTTRHGDYMAGWNADITRAWTDKCINVEWNCQTQFISNELGDFGVEKDRYAFLNPTTNDEFAGVGPIIVDVVDPTG